jgi:hypothetical protein
METEMDLNWLDRIEQRRREWGGGFFLADAEVEFVLAAARAHLEQCKCDWSPRECPVHQPPQQREDDAGRLQREWDQSSAILEQIGCGTLPGAKPSPDVGLVERLRRSVNIFDPDAVLDAIAAIEAKDAEIERLNTRSNREWFRLEGALRDFLKGQGCDV